MQKRRGISRRRASAGHVGIRAEIAGRVRGPHPIAVGAVRRQPGIGVRRRRRGRADLHESRAPRVLTLHQVPGHPHVVRRRRPIQCNRGAARCGRQISRRRRRLRVQGDRRVHVCLDLGRRQGYVVDADFVDHSLEVLPVNAVPTQLQRIGRRQDGARLRRARHLDSVHVKPQDRSVIGCR